MDNRRLILLLIFSFSLVMLWDAWQRQHAVPAVAGMPSPAAVAQQPGGPAAVPGDVPPAAVGAVPAASPSSVAAPAANAGQHAGSVAIVRTDLYEARISAHGGDIVALDLLAHPDSQDKSRPVRLFDTGERGHTYFAQSGVIGANLPNHRNQWAGAEGEHSLKTGESTLRLVLTAQTPEGAAVTKTYVFSRGSYQINIEHAGLPAGAAIYHQVTRDGKPAEGAGSNAMMMGVTTFTGPAVYTDAAKYQKVEFAEIEKGKAKFAAKASDGWLAMVQHYFVAAWLPAAGIEREYFMRKGPGDLYSAGVVSSASADGTHAMSLYAGPQEQDKLSAIAPGLELVVDYGWLTVIAAPLFWVLQMLHQLAGNWGWAIIGLTVLLKLAFFPLSAASYKSMAKMRVLTPKLMKLKETFGDDKQRLNQEMMELYKREKVNPLGGCLPVLVQIPVFIALYWVLLGAVEMRNAPWLGWITDLSVKDPYFVLPLIMGATMLIQTKLNPTPPDPIQAKIMLFMPIVFTVMFLWFPAGLVLYWTVNNLLSIAQQWQITRRVEGAGKGKAA